MKLVCAPMATVSHEAFRRSVEQFGGCDEYFTEMINAPSLVSGGPFESFYLLNSTAPQKIVWQLTGSGSETLAQAAEIIVPKGGAGIDINMGCCAPQIFRTGAGIAWMLRPVSQAKAAVQAVRDILNRHESQTGIHLRLSIKCRLGGEDFSEESLFAFADAVAEGGAELISLHPRTQKEKYRGIPRYEFAEKLAVHFSGALPVYVNGCIHDAESARAVLNAVPHADGLMIARAAAERPWIFSVLKNALSFPGQERPFTVDRQQVALSFIDGVEQFQPPEFHRTRIQRFFSYYCGQFQFAHYFQSRMLNFKSVEESRREVRDYFARQPNERFLAV
ncbi:MAG: tRNA-dihydrouridine synthase family protein [Treponema sp.]|nr:tRNA-dihydrouridine synthase family protein [Treponema sp.]